MSDRDLLLQKCWIDTRYGAPEHDPKFSHYPVTCIGVVDDTNLQLAGEQRFIDVVSYWPASKVWTVTHQCRADEGAIDFPCRVTYFQPLFPMPWG